jgi:hypothetical protein
VHSRFFARVAGFAAVAALVLGAALPASATTNWQSGQHFFGGVSVEPAVDMATGNQIFLLTPNGAPTNPVKANQRAHAPLYLVLYPTGSTIDPATLNCTPANCNHAQIPGIIGHDHLVGLPHTGDFNVAWDVYLIFFTPKGIDDLAINNRILTGDELTAALDAHDVFNAGFLLSFNCSKVSMATYLHHG